MRYNKAFQCDGKAKHKTKKQAVFQILNSKKGMDDKAIKRLKINSLEPYHCPHCGFWHVGHKLKQNTRS